jgi:hypothetical protein
MALIATVFNETHAGDQNGEQPDLGWHDEPQGSMARLGDRQKQKRHGYQSEE